MDLKLTFIDCYCATGDFAINRIEADLEDFGDEYDHAPGNAEPYCCGDMRFERKDATQEVLSKYKISEDEYEEICDLLGEGLYVGHCCMCS